MSYPEHKSIIGQTCTERTGDERSWNTEVIYHPVSNLSDSGQLTMKNVVKEKSFAFAVRVVNLYKFLTTNKKEYVLAKQVLRSGTAIGALVREAEQAESKPDFITKWRSHWKKRMKPSTGWNSWTRPSISTQHHLHRSTKTSSNFWSCSPASSSRQSNLDQPSSPIKLSIIHCQLTIRGMQKTR